MCEFSSICSPSLLIPEAACKDNNYAYMMIIINFKMKYVNTESRPAFASVLLTGCAGDWIGINVALQQAKMVITSFFL